MSNHVETANDSQRPTKRRKIDKARSAQTTDQECVTVDKPQQNRNEYKRTTLNHNSRAIQGDVYGNVYLGCDHDQQEEKDKYKALLDSLPFPRMGARLRNVDPEMAETCQWLFTHPQFTTWSDKQKIALHHGFLWIKGKPGSGKSTIMRAAYCWAKDKWSKHVNLSYFFNGRAPGRLEKSSLGLYRSLAHQALNKLPEVRRAFIEKFEAKDIGGVVEEWTAAELKGFLRDVFVHQQKSPINIFVDALDEGDEDDVRQMITYFEELGRAATSGRSSLRILLSSRHYPHISIDKALSLILEDQIDHSKDIKTYVKNMLPNETEDDFPAMTALQNEIFTKSKSVFLWVVLVIPMLKKEYDKGGSLKVKATRRLLAKIPAKLDELFRQILDQSEEDIECCTSLLQWVLFARRALSPIELYVATSCSSIPGEDILGSIPPPERLSKYILEWSRGLVEVTKSEPCIVQFIHETVRTFLLGASGLSQVKPSLAQNIEGLSHNDLRDACFRYLKLAKPPDAAVDRSRSANFKAQISDFVEKRPLVDYVTHGILEHANSAESHALSQTTFLEMLSASTDNFWSKWINFHNYFERFSTGELTQRASLLYVVTKLKLVHLVQGLAVSTDIINAQGERYGSALGVACSNEDEETVRLLVERGADISLLCQFLGKSRSAALHIKNVNIIKFVYENGGTLPNTFEYAVTKAIERGDEQKFRLLLDLVTDLNIIIYRPYTMLGYACRKNRSAMVQALLERKVDVNFRRDLYQNLPITSAARSGDIELVKALLKAGADIAPRGGAIDDPLITAAHEGHSDIVKLFLDLETDDNTRKSRCNDALHGASCYYRYETVEMLLKEGADVHYQHPKEGGALHAACLSPHFFVWDSSRSSTVQMLLEAGADVNLRGGTYGSPLCAASGVDGKLEIVKLLLKAGAALGSTNWQQAPSKHVPLFQAAVNGQVEIVKILLDAGAHIEGGEGFLEKAISLTSAELDKDRPPWNEREEVIEILQQYVGMSHGEPESAM